MRTVRTYQESAYNMTGGRVHVEAVPDPRHRQGCAPHDLGAAHAPELLQERGAVHDTAADGDLNRRVPGIGDAYAVHPGHHGHGLDAGPLEHAVADGFPANGVVAPEHPHGEPLQDHHPPGEPPEMVCRGNACGPRAYAMRILIIMVLCSNFSQEYSSLTSRSFRNCSAAFSVISFEYIITLVSKFRVTDL